jgi:hypothetical protein
MPKFNFHKEIFYKNVCFSKNRNFRKDLVYKIHFFRIKALCHKIKAAVNIKAYYNVDKKEHVSKI